MKRTDVYRTSGGWKKLATYPDILRPRLGADFFIGQERYVVSSVRDSYMAPDGTEVLVIIVEGPKP